MTMKRVAVVTTLVLGTSFATLALADDDPVAKGRELFNTQKCTMCHQAEGKGNAHQPLDGVGSKLKPEEIKKWITSPKEMKADSKMKSYASLPAADVDALVAYVSSLKKKD
jgi:cytochrome c2